MPVPVLVVLRILLNPASNLLQKHLAQAGFDPRIITAVTYGVIALAALPALFYLPRNTPFLANLAALAVLDVAGNTLLVASLERLELSVFGPLNAYKAVFSTVFALVVLGELPGPGALAGIALIAAGTHLLEPRMPLWRERAVQIRLLSMAILALDAVFLKRCVELSSPALTLAAWALASAPLAMLAAPFRIHKHTSPLHAHRFLFALLAAASGAAQACVVYTLDGVPVGAAMALFQTSALLNLWLGARFFGESGIWRKLAAAALMLGGAALTLS